MADAKAAAFCSVSSCDDLHVLLAGGNNDPHSGHYAALVEATCFALSDCGHEHLIYLTFFYCQTVYDSTIAGHTHMTAYAARCPNSKLVLRGYSQGSQIAIKILGGGRGLLFNRCIQPDVLALDPTTSPRDKSE